MERKIIYMMNRKIITFLCLFILLLSGCGIRPSEEDNVTETWGSFTADQTYSYDRKYYAIQETEEDPDNGWRYIKVCVYETGTDALIDCFYPARASDFWGICWENDTYNIWTQSADIGVCCFKYEDMKWQKDESAQRPDYIISKYDE